MSMIRCDKCSRSIDSNDDPDCFDEKADQVTCKPCREVAMTAAQPGVLSAEELADIAEWWGVDFVSDVDVEQPTQKLHRTVFAHIRALTAQLAKVEAERDAAEQALSQAYYLVTGKSPAWSSTFLERDLLAEIKDSVEVLKASVRDNVFNNLLDRKP